MNKDSSLDVNETPILNVNKAPTLNDENKASALDNINVTPALDVNKDAPGRPGPSREPDPVTYMYY